MNNIIIPIIRKVMPGLIAQQIIGVQPMAPPTGNIFSMNSVFGDKTYSKKFWPHQIMIDRSKIVDAERWCWNRFKGKYWSSSGGRFVFKRSKDAVIFALRWS
jgi:hypothetical protein